MEEDEPSPNRLVPVAVLIADVIVLAQHDWYVTTEHKAFVYIVFFFPAVGMLALASTVHPPSCTQLQNTATACRNGNGQSGYSALCGVIVGFVLFKVVYHF